MHLIARLLGKNYQFLNKLIYWKVAMFFTKVGDYSNGQICWYFYVYFYQQVETKCLCLNSVKVLSRI